MTVRVTLRLPEPVYKRIAEASRETGRSLNQVMVDALREADLHCGPGPDASDFEKLRWAAREHAPPWTDEDDALMAEVFPDDDPDAPVLTHEELWELMPKLPPEKWASTIIIEDREDRF
ncbi:MAG: ribbon-helix-helix protein, CopG family [Dehalococcoidia bacterium]